MMYRVLVFLIVCVLLAGCGAERPPGRTYAKHNLAGGRYLLECEDTGGGSSLTFTSTSEGTVVTKELYEFTWGDTHRLRIEDGKLTVDGADRGTLEPGDRVTITANGDLLVNGSPRQ